MLLKKALFCLTAVLFIAPLFAADLTVQSIGLSIDRKSPSYNIELLLKKVILSVGASNQNVRLYSSDKPDLEFTGIRELNGEVLMKAVKKGGAYQIELYEAASGKKPVLFDDTVRMSLKNFGDTVNDTALQIIGSIAKKFPPKLAAQLTKINLVKIKLSEYESADGFWALSVIPAYSLLDINAAVSKQSSASVGRTFKHNGGALLVEGIYRVQQWNFGVGASASMGGWNEGGFHASYNDFSAHAFFGYGLFGSIIVIGVQPEFTYLMHRTDFTNYYVSYSNIVVVPDITARFFRIHLFMQINISRDYFLTFTAAPPFGGGFFNGLNLDFNKNGQYSYYSNVTVPAEMIDSGFCLRLALNFRLFQSWWLRFVYDTLTPGFSKYSNDRRNDLPVSTDGMIFLDNLKVNKTRIGLGIQYDF